jgi:hypothetical protein
MMSSEQVWGRMSYKYIMLSFLLCSISIYLIIYSDILILRILPDKILVVILQSAEHGTDQVF